MLIKKRGLALVFALIVVLVLTILGSLALFRSVSENRISKASLEEAQALLLADAGINRAQYEIRQNFSLSGSNLFTTSSGPGKYNFDITVSGSPGVRNYAITSRGCLPASCNCISLPNDCNMTRQIQANMNEYQNTPVGFYDNAIYSAGNVAIGIEPVGGNVFSGGTVNGPIEAGYTRTENDPTLQANGLPSLDFEALRQTSIDQGWYNASTNVTTYPTSFWYEAPSPSNPTGLPNVVFVNGDFKISGNKEIGGFVVVGGNAVYDATIGGTTELDGCLYTRGDVILNGGGGPSPLNINGGVWAGETVTMNGNPNIDYNQTYMYAIRDALHPNTDVRITAWLDTQNSYSVSP